MYEIGSTVSINASFRSNLINHPTGIDKFKIEGVVIKTPSYVEYDAVTIKTGNPDFPISIIPTKCIDGYIPVKNTSVQTHEVISGSNTYIVTVSGNKVNCSCVGFQFRRYCKHSDKFKSV